MRPTAIALVVVVSTLGGALSASQADPNQLPGSSEGDPKVAPLVSGPADRDVDQPESARPVPTPQGLEYKRVTAIAAEEWDTPDAHFHWLLQRIAAGVADARVMRQYAWARTRLTPFTRAVPFGWRQAAWPRFGSGMPQRGEDPTPQEGAVGAGTGPGGVGAGEPDASIASFGRWLNVGPDWIPGRVTGLARPARMPQTILAAMADGGLWRSQDRGQTWEPLTDREATQASGAVATHPDDPLTYYWATGEGNGAIDNYGGIGVLRTHDGGRTWLASNAFSGSFRGLTVNHHQPDEIWAAGDRLFRSIDGGVTFQRVFGGTPENGAVGVLIHPSDPNRMWATFWGPGLYQSTDAGSSWSAVAGGLPSGIGRSEVALCAADPNVMFVYGESDGGDLWKSTDGGTTWNAVFTADFDPCGGQCWYDMSLAIAPDDCNAVYLGGVDAFVSRNGGGSWTSVGAAGSSVHVDHHALLVGAAGEVVMGSDGGVFRSVDYGTTFQTIGLGLPTTQYYGACGSDVEAGMLFGGTQDNGSHRRRNSDGWAWLLGGDGGMCAIGGNKLLGEYQVTNLTRSLDGGASWGDANSGIDGSDPKSWVGIIEKDPLNANTLYVGTNKVYRTLNFKDTPWKQIAGPLYFSRQVTTLAVSPVDRNVLWVGYDLGGLYRTANATSSSTVTWTNVKQNLPNRAIRRVAPHPANAAAAWVVIGGYGNPRLMFTSNSGLSYSDVTGDLPDVPVNDLVIDPADTNVLMVGTDLGVMRSDDGGQHWYGFSDGLPSVAVIDLFRHPADGTVIAATHGRSMYRFHAASSAAVAIPDGRNVSGSPLRAQRTGDDRLWLRWDTATCTATHYQLFYGALSAVGLGVHDGAVCDLPRGGEVVITMPGTAGDSLYFLISGSNAAGTEGPHGYDSSGNPRPHNGVGFCGVIAHQAAATCP